MMADGYSRNDAQEIAERVQGDGSYEQTYHALHTLKSLPNLQQSIAQAVETAVRVIRAFAEAMGAFVRVFNESMEAQRKKRSNGDGVSKG